jgi:hypothetical protein
LIARSSFLIAGIGFTIQGLYGIYFFSARGLGHGADWLGIFTSLSFLGFPVGILCLSIFYLWTVRPKVAHFWGYLEVGVCLVFHVLQFVLAMTVVSEPLRFGGALLAISFGFSNFMSAFQTG